MMKYKIYKLVHPEYDVVYVGITKNTLSKRKSGNYKGTSIEAISKECDIKLIEETDDVSRERFWIKKYSNTILNQRLGSGQTLDDRRKQIRDSYHKNKKCDDKITKGYHWCNSKNKWIVRKREDGKVKYIGSFKKEEDAAIAYKNYINNYEDN